MVRVHPLVTTPFTHFPRHHVKHERLPKKVMSVASRMVSYVPGSAALCASQNSHLIETDAALLCLANCGQQQWVSVGAMLLLRAFVVNVLLACCEILWIKYLRNYPFHIVPCLYREAESFKEQGNAFYVKKDYAEAFNYYTKAIGK